MKEQLAPHKAALLQKIGRNVVVFARLEAQIAALAARTRYGTAISFPEMSPIQLPSPKKPKRSLGKLLDQLCKNLFADQDPIPRPDGYDGSWAEHSFQIEMPKAAQKEWKRDLIKLVSERNHLIHVALDSLDLESQAATESFAEHLDGQYGRLCAAIEKLNALAFECMTFFHEAQQAFQSGNYIVVEGDPSDAT